MTTHTQNRGFTLIELLVVIAIIGILASVVLASLNTARDKGANAAVKSNLANSRAEAEIYYDTNRNYTDVCLSTATNDIYDNVTAAGAATGASVGRDAAVSATAAACNDAATAWAAAAPYADDSFSWCVDSTGVSKEIAVGALGAAATACP